MKTYLYPRRLRVGAPSIVAVQKKMSSAGHVVHELLVYHTLTRSGISRPRTRYQGYGREYDDLHVSRISEPLYKALIAEAKTNHKKYKEID
jgi:hypothetical protein